MNKQAVEVLTRRSITQNQFLTSEQNPNKLLEVLQEQNDDFLSSSHPEDESSQVGSSCRSTNNGADSTKPSDTSTAGPHASIQSEVESRKVGRVRTIVVLVLIATAIAVSAAVFKITVQGEVHEFETQYETSSRLVLDRFQGIVAAMGSVAGLGVSFTSQGKHRNNNEGAPVISSNDTSWPFVTLVDFPPRARNVLQLSGALMVGMSPVLRGTLFEPWNDYVDHPANQLWIQESLAYQKAQGWEMIESEDSSISQDRVVDVMHYSDEDGIVLPEVPGQDWYLPMWQTSPYVASLVNNNLLRYENTTEVVRHVYDSHSAVLGSMKMAPPGSIHSPDPDTALLAALLSAQEDSEVDYLGDPVTDFFIPVFNAIKDEVQSQVVGVVHALIHWKSYLHQVLPESVQGIVVVLEYDCGSTFIHDHKNQEEENAQQRRRTKEGTSLTNTRDLETTFTIFTPAPNHPLNSYWNAHAHTSPPTTSYWDADAHTSPPTAHTVHPSNSYWNVEDQFTPEPTTSNLGVDSFSTPEPTTETPPPSDKTANTTPPTTETTAEVTVTQAEQQPKEEEPPIDTSLPEATPSNVTSSFFTYIIEGSEVQVLGTGDLHDPTYDAYMRQGSFTSQSNVLEDGTLLGIPIDERCNYHLYVYPSKSFEEGYITTTPISITIVVVAVFIFAIMCFLFYNRMVERRQRRILKKATQSSAIVSSLFPKNVRDRLLAGGEIGGARFENAKNQKSRLRGFMAGELDENEKDEDTPIADLFPHCTVFFADIAGFTAWSSTREPSQVFILLQNVYQAFDALAKRRRVFKVETIGDCYMAVTGLPEPQDSHASIMVRFAYDCITKMREETKKLESQLGPDTTELVMRIGLHSGPVTAGVLKGDMARFQLFGDTVNTASRMESTGTRGKIQVSEATANILREHGRGHWLTPRADSVKAKGKGVLKTYWANPKNKHNSSSAGSSSKWETRSADPDEETSETSDDESAALQQAHIRLVDWIVKLMSDDIRKILFARQQGGQVKNREAPSYIPPDGKTCMDEVKEVIRMPKFDDAKQAHGDAYKKIQIDADITRDLGEYVTAIAKMYRQNPFHNFEHACHVTMSVNKLIRRIVAPELSDKVDSFETKNASDNNMRLAAHLHDCTYGINSDPMAMFAMTFSALIHDVDHQGISNMQLAVENPDMAKKYNKKSLAEQNSLDLAWEILMESRFADLRKFLFVSEQELLRFRQLIVNIVLATDIFDKELNDLRKNRWKRAFSGEAQIEDTQQSDLRATIVIEHIIQASDVSHTMQHWHVYQKWNKCLFREMHAAFKAGRLAKDPATFWYKGEIGFFDNYIIPLAKKLNDCGVFGVCSAEYLNYAQQNRAEWEERGAEIVASLIDELRDSNHEEEEAAAAAAAHQAKHVGRRSTMMT